MSTAVSSVPLQKTSSAITWVIGVLLAVNLAAILYVAIHRTENSSPSEPTSVITQADKLFGVMKDYSSELQNVAGQASYKTDAEKTAGTTAVKQNKVNLELARMALAKLDERRDRDSLIEFVETAAYMNFGPPSFSRYTEGKFEGGQYIPGKNEQYANTSRLESMNEDFVVLLTAMLKDAR